MVERLHGMQEVTGSIPVFSTPLAERLSEKSGSLCFSARFKHGLNNLRPPAFAFPPSQVEFEQPIHRMNPLSVIRSALPSKHGVAQSESTA